MNVTLYGWTFNFHKVVRQQNSGAVEDFILPQTRVEVKQHTHNERFLKPIYLPDLDW